MDKVDYKLLSLSKSKFRSSFHLNNKMKDYVKNNGIDKVREDAYYFIKQRIAAKEPKNDGKQTPMKQVHPIFIAQHACGCCCRGCIEKWHGIPKGRELTKTEIDYLVSILMAWINKEMR